MDLGLYVCAELKHGTALARTRTTMAKEHAARRMVLPGVYGVGPTCANNRGQKSAESGVFDLALPGSCPLQRAVYIVDVLNAGGVEPVAERLLALRCEDGNAILPRGAATEDAVVSDAGFIGQFECLDEHGIRDAGGEVDKGEVRDRSGIAEVLHGFGAGVGTLAFVGLGAGDKLHIDGYLNLEDVDAV